MTGLSTSETVSAEARSPGADIAVVLGTRPEIIKLAPIVRQLRGRTRVIHSGQHYDDELSGQHFREQGIGAPDVVLSGVGGGSRSAQIAATMLQLADEFAARRPAVVLVQGDTNTVSAGAQAAHYAGIPVLHVEAGLRSRDRGMPEEINRLITGALADVHCAPTRTSAENLLREGIDPRRVVITGNPVVEATEWGLAAGGSTAYGGPSIPLAPYALATIHRPENTDTEEALTRVLCGLRDIPIPVLFLAHPRTRLAIERFQLWHLLEGITIAESPGYTDFLRLAAGSDLLISDSGGIQEECTVLKVPLAVVRRSTERPEAIDAGFARLITPDLDLGAEIRRMLSSPDLRATLASTPSPFGDGAASVRIARLAEDIADGGLEHALAGRWQGGV